MRGERFHGRIGKQPSGDLPASVPADFYVHQGARGDHAIGITRVATRGYHSAEASVDKLRMRWISQQEV